jgi:hypothetical protein
MNKPAEMEIPAIRGMFAKHVLLCFVHMGRVFECRNPRKKTSPVMFGVSNSKDLAMPTGRCLGCWDEIQPAMEVFNRENLGV